MKMGTEWLITIQLVGKCGSVKEIFFHSLDLNIWNSYIILSPCGRPQYRHFHLVLVKKFAGNE